MKIKKILSGLLAALLIIMCSPIAALAEITDTDDSTIVRTTETNYYTTVVLHVVIDHAENSDDIDADTYNISYDEDEGDISDENIQMKINESIAKAKEWCAQKGVNITDQDIEQGISDSYHEVHDEIENKMDAGDFKVYITTYLDKHQVYTININVKSDNQPEKESSTNLVTGEDISSSKEGAKPWVVIGIVGGLLVLGGCAFAIVFFIRRKNREK